MHLTDRAAVKRVVAGQQQLRRVCRLTGRARERCDGTHDVLRADVGVQDVVDVVPAACREVALVNEPVREQPCGGATHAVGEHRIVDDLGAVLLRGGEQPRVEVDPVEPDFRRRQRRRCHRHSPPSCRGPARPAHP